MTTGKPQSQSHSHPKLVVILYQDVYDPLSMLSGGSAPSSSGTLDESSGVVRSGEEAEVRQQLDELKNAEAKRKVRRDMWKKLHHELEIKEYEM